MANHTTKHAKFLNLALLILVCKYREKLLIPVGDAIQSILRDIVGAKRIRVRELVSGVAEFSIINAAFVFTSFQIERHRLPECP